MSGENLVKIGVAEDPKSRVESFRIARPDIKLLGHIPGGREVESHLHQRFSHARIERSEWFEMTPEIELAINERVGKTKALSVLSDPLVKKPSKPRQ
jgi:hypothetical protein